MKRAILAAFGLLVAALTANAQVKVDSVFFDARGGILANVGQGGQFDINLTGESLNLNMWGHLTPSVTYRFRQRFTKPLYDSTNPLNATDWLLITWNISPRWSVNAGKMPTLVGGFEWDYAPVDLYFVSDFANSIAQCYALGGTLMYNVAPGQQLQLQATRSLLSDGPSNILGASFGWYGSFAPWWKTIWAYTFMDDPYRHRMGYLALGNRFEAGPAALELDFMYRKSLLGGMGPDLSVTALLSWKVGKCQLIAKGGYDYNDSSNVDGNGVPYDLTVAPGTRYAFAGGGVEYFPLGNRHIRLHGMGWWDNRSNVFTLNAGITFRLYVVK